MNSSKLPSGYTCTCGKVHAFPLYVYAHWRDDLHHACECGAEHDIRCGVAIPRANPSKKRGAK